MALDADTAALLVRLHDRGESALFSGALEADRERFAAQLRETARPAARAPQVHTDGPVPVRVHRPEQPSGALAVFVHGGGWALGGGDAYDGVAARLAVDTGAVVAALDYRLAPEAPFPAPFDDVLAGVDDVLGRAGEFGADPSRCALVGDSAGANLVAGAALARRDAGRSPRAMLLVYPPPDFEARYPSLAENAEGRWLTGADVRACSRLYLGGHDPRGDVRVSPLRADLAGLPPTIVATAGYDPLRDAGAAFAGALRDAGVDVRLREHPALTHGFLGFTAVVPAADAAVAALHEELVVLLA